MRFFNPVGVGPIKQSETNRFIRVNKNKYPSVAARIERGRLTYGPKISGNCQAGRHSTCSKKNCTCDCAWCHNKTRLH